MNPDDCIKLNSGQLMPLVGLGTAYCVDDEVRTAVHSALECGYRSFDTAYLYENEKAIGDVLQDWFSKGKLKREEVFVTTKLPPIALRAESVARFLDLSLESLKLSYLDLYIIHHPFGLKCEDDNAFGIGGSTTSCIIDDDTDHESLWKELEKQVDAGKTKAIGVSNFNSEQVQRILKIARIPPAVNQVEVHVRLSQRRLVEKCQKLGVAVVAYSSFGAPYCEEGRMVSVLDHPTILAIGERHGRTSAQVILKFLVQRGMVVIPKSMNPSRIASNIKISGFQLSDEEMKSLYDLDVGEKARVYHFKEIFKGSENHKEYPFHLQE